MALLDIFRRGKAAASPAGKRKRVAAAVLDAAGATPAECSARRKAAAGMPGFRGAQQLLGEAVAAGATAILLEHLGGSVGLRRRIDNDWQAADPLDKEKGAGILAAIKTLAAPIPGAGQGVQEGEIVVALKNSRRPCRVTVRAIPNGEQVMLLLGGELPPPAKENFSAVVGGFLGRLLPGRGRKEMAAAAVDESLPKVSFDVPRGGNPDEARVRLERAVAAEGYQQACNLVASAIKARACEVLIEVTEKDVAVHQEVDGVWRPSQNLDRTAGDAAIAAIKMVSGLDSQERRRRQAGQCITVIETKPWPCRVVSQGVPSGERLQLSLDHGRPKFKTIADTGMPDPLAKRVRELSTLESGLIVVATPKRGGLSTLFSHVVGAADRMVRDFVCIEDAAAPELEIQNVKPVRWDAAKQISPAGAVELAMREYPGALVTCELKDAGLAAALMAQAEQGRLVIVGIRGADAVDGLVNLMALGIAPETLSRTLLAAIGGKLIRKLCPKCQEEYVPPLDLLMRLRLDPEHAPTLRRAAEGGCSVCAGTGYLGRTGIFEIASGKTLAHYLAKQADAKVLRQAAVKDGMQPMQQEGLARVMQGVTSLEEIQRVFRKG
jgi:type II secretory ATPase GspE/PulE/Tfp pilus assembly ATPase PilB-like protein